MLTELYLLRHGQTDWNHKSIIQGHQDIDLNQKGQQQAAKAAQLFTETDLDYIYSSDLKRAKNTASFTAENKNLKIIQNEKLREINFGQWEGLTFSEIQTKYPQKAEKWQQDPLHHSPPEGENLLDFKKRVNSFFGDLIKENQGEKSLVVTHGGVIKLYLTTVLALETKNYWQFQIDNCSLTVLKFYDQKMILNKLNFTN